MIEASISIHPRLATFHRSCSTYEDGEWKGKDTLSDDPLLNSEIIFSPVRVEASLPLFLGKPAAGRKNRQGHSGMAGG